jgi:hypothetical protein
MGILDDAIREHLDLKRKHGARESEIAEIEDEALGSGERPDPFAARELFGEVASPGESAPKALEPELRPPTPPPAGLEEPRSPEEPTALVEPSVAPPVPPTSEPSKAEPPEPSFPEPPPAEPPPLESPSAPEPPAESLEELMAQEEEPAVPEAADRVPPPPPPESEVAARPEPPSPPPPAATEGQRGRAQGRADVPTQEHITPREETADIPPVPSEAQPEPVEQSGPELYDFEADAGLLDEEGAESAVAPPPADESDDFEALGPAEEGDEAEELYPDEDEAYGEQRGGTTDFEEVDAVEEAHETEVRPAAPEHEEDEHDRTEGRPAAPEEEEDDLLSESPEFLDEDDDEGLWFEKGPPKDFDFEDEEK